MNNCVFSAFTATLGTWLLTALGSATVLLFKNTKLKLMNLFLGFSAGVMIAASFWSLLEPAIEQAEMYSAIPASVVATLGFLSGALFMWLCDRIVCISQKKLNKNKKALSIGTNRIILLVLSVTLHNIPEGLAVGVAFGALNRQNVTPEAFMGAVSIALGIGLQNFPEGAAVSLPLRREGYSKAKSFLIGQASGMVEPVGGVVGALLVMYVTKALPYALSFAAGAMVLVAVHELIPECRKGQRENCYFSTMGIICGFAVMMFLDVALG